MIKANILKLHYPLYQKGKTKNIKKSAEGLVLFVKETETLGFSFQERQKLFLLYKEDIYNAQIQDIIYT